MNTLEHEMPVLKETGVLREQMLTQLTDADLAYRLPGTNPSLGELCKEIGEVQRAYIDSFKNFELKFEYQHPEDSVTRSVSALVAWYEQMDDELYTVLNNLSDDDIENRMIHRGGWQVKPRVQLHIYREALLIFYGRADCYMKALNKPLSQQWKDWIG